MDRKYFQTRQIGIFPVDAVVEGVGKQAFDDLLMQHGRAFILQVLEYDHESNRVSIILKPGNGMVPVVAMEEASGVKDCE
jgi:hypothetical protein